MDKFSSAIVSHGFKSASINRSMDPLNTREYPKQSEYPLESHAKSSIFLSWSIKFSLANLWGEPYEIIASLKLLHSDALTNSSF